MKWRKSSHSANTSDCVEVAVATDRTAIRDTKNRAGGKLTVAAESWSHFLADIKDRSGDGN